VSGAQTYGSGNCDRHPAGRDDRGFVRERDRDLELEFPMIPAWEVRSYPTGVLLHTAYSYEAADDWRLVNNQASVVIPHWSHE
jgi:hypothetical protein